MKKNKKNLPGSSAMGLVRMYRRTMLKLKSKHFDPIQRLEDKKIRERLLKWIEEGGPFDDETMTEVAERFEITKEQLSYYFRSRYGENFLAWRRIYRVNAAEKMMLGHPELTIKEIMQSVGIYDRANFRKMFIVRHGVSPEKWRNSKLKK